MTTGRNSHKSTMRAQGNGYIVSHWDEGVHCYREGGETTYWQARASVGSANCRNPAKCQIASHNHQIGD